MLYVFKVSVGGPLCLLWLFIVSPPFGGGRWRGSDPDRDSIFSIVSQTVFTEGT